MSGTFVLTTLGYAGIECIRAGDYVYAKDEETGEQEYMPVLDTFTNEVTEICTLTIDDETIETTVGHPFYSVENGWINAGDLSEGDTVELSDGSSGRVENVEITELDEPVTVYNFCVMDFHTYYVGESEVLVHNVKCKTKKVDESAGNSTSSNSSKTSDHMVGENGTQLSSKTTWKNGKTERIDVENPSPGTRPGQIHYHDATNKKFHYDMKNDSFYDTALDELAPKSVQNMLNNNDFRKGIKKAMNILGE